MAAAILEAPLPSVHHCTHPLNAAHLGLFADPWNSPFHNFRLPEPFPPTTSSTFSSAPIAIATDDTSHPSEMPPKGPPPSSPAVPRTLSHPPRLRAKPTSPVDVQGKLVRRRPATYVDRVAKLRNPSVAVTNAGPTSTPSEGRTTRSTANHVNSILQARQPPLSVLSWPSAAVANLRFTDDDQQESPQLQAPVGSSLVTRRRRRSPNPDFTPPRLRRTQPEGLWAPLTGNARAVAAAFRERSPIPSRRSVLPPDAPAPSGSSHPVPTAPRPRMMRRASSYSEREAENGGRTTSWDETAASWRGDSGTGHRRSRRLSYSPGKCSTGRDHGLQRHSYLSPELAPGADEPLRSFSEELGRLSIGSSDEEEEMSAPSPPPPPPRRRRGLTRSKAGVFRMGEDGGLEHDDRNEGYVPF